MISRADIAAVKGFLTPAMVGHDDRGRIINAFADPEDVKRIESGYACGDCAATFHSFQLICPLCKSELRIANQRQDTPADWQAHADERNYGGGKTAPRSSDEFLASLAGDGDVDHVPLSKLGPRRNRSAR